MYGGVRIVCFYVDMTVDNSTDLSDNADGTTQTAFSDSELSLANIVELYLGYGVIGIGIFGTGCNAVVLYALIVHRAQESKKRGVHLLIINQNLLDLCCCFTIVISLSLIVSNIYLKGALGYILCAVFTSSNAAFGFFNASVINLMTLTIERYLKVVYPFWSKKNLKSWMINACIVFAWIAGFLSIIPVGFVTSFVAKGTCISFGLYFADTGIRVGHGIWSFISFFLLPMIVFVYCYGHIVVVMRRQMRVMAAHNVEGSVHNASQVQSKQMKWNIIKTMIIVTAFFAVCWSPLNIWLVAVKANVQINERAVGYTAVFLTYINISLNPFIYVTKYDGVRRVLARMIICRKHSEVGGVIGT